jgi:REP element-mobilizing transposase RayT
MSEKYKAKDDLPYFVTMTFQGWVDLFTREVYRELFVDALLHCHKEKGLIIHEYVIMSNHAHLILQHRDSRLSDIIRDFKAHVAREVLKCLKTDNTESRREWALRLFKYYAKYLKQNKNYVVWRKSNRPIVLDNPELYERCLDYIYLNPVKAGLVLAPNHWLYSSACNENPINDILRKQYGEGA